MLEELHINKRGLLERSEHDFDLRNVSEPELYRCLYNYDEVPKVAFNDRKVPMIVPENGGLRILLSAMDSSLPRPLP